MQNADSSSLFDVDAAVQSASLFASEADHLSEAQIAGVDNALLQPIEMIEIGTLEAVRSRLLSRTPPESQERIKQVRWPGRGVPRTHQ